MCHKTQLDARQHKYLTCQNFTSSLFPVMLIPLLDPEDLAPRVTQQQKRIILAPLECPAEMIQDGTPETCRADGNLDDITWLFTFDKHPSVYQELLWMLFASRVVDFSPGNGPLALQCIRLKIPIVLIVKNAEHKNIIQDHLARQLSAFMCDPMDERFYYDVATCVEGVLRHHAPGWATGWNNDARQTCAHS